MHYCRYAKGLAAFCRLIKHFGETSLYNAALLGPAGMHVTNITTDTLSRVGFNRLVFALCAIVMAVGTLLVELLRLHTANNAFVAAWACPAIGVLCTAHSPIANSFVRTGEFL